MQKYYILMINQIILKQKSIFILNFATLNFSSK